MKIPELRIRELRLAWVRSALKREDDKAYRLWDIGRANRRFVTLEKRLHRINRIAKEWGLT